MDTRQLVLLAFLMTTGAVLVAFAAKPVSPAAASRLRQPVPLPVAPPAPPAPQEGADCLNGPGPVTLSPTGLAC